MPTPTPVPRDRRRAQAGAITIMVALFMLVLLTIAALGMSRNSFREIITTGFARQGALANNVADSGLEWSVYWITLANAPQAVGTGGSLVALKANLLKNPSLAGVAKDINDTTGAKAYVPGGSVQADMTLPIPSGATASSQGGFTLGLTNMGKLDLTGMSQGAGQSAYTPATGGINTQAPDLWVIRADAQVPQGNVTFTHGKEAWVSTPVQ